LPLALYVNRTPAVARITLGDSDTLVLFTDGVTEATNPSQDEFGDAALIETLIASRNLSADDIVSRVFRSVDEFSQGTEQADDITCIVMNLRAGDDGADTFHFAPTHER
jgi:sigma-B regulation protein RsbU (phosphoserine phosphatase)